MNFSLDISKESKLRTHCQKNKISVHVFPTVGIVFLEDGHEAEVTIFFYPSEPPK